MTEGLQQSPKEPSGSRTVLIVDDSLTVRMDLCGVFENAGFTSTACQSLAAARQALARQSFTLLILDILLPDGDGIDLLREIRSTPELADLPVMVLSTEAEVGDRVRGLKTGADEYIGKPYDPGYILLRARQMTGAVGGFASGSSPRALIIDDSQTFRSQFQEALESAGYSVITAATGEGGLQLAITTRPDIAIVDRVLPGPLDGTGVIRRLKQDTSLRNIPCLLLTGSQESEDELSSLDAGADAYLCKETDLSVILARIAALVRSAGETGAANEAATSLLGAKKILAVDDSPTYLNELARQLQAEHYDVIGASSGREALSLLDIQPVDCILLDVRMPGLSGFETCAKIKQTRALRNIPLIILTAVEETQAILEGINAGADDYVSKATDFEVLKARVRAQLRRKHFEEEHRRVREQLIQTEREAEKAKAAQQIAEARAALVEELENKNRGLEAFAYSVSHDLRAPLRAVQGFSGALLSEYAAGLAGQAVDYLNRIQAAANRMSALIEALQVLSRVGSAGLRRQKIDLSQLARAAAAELTVANPGRCIDFGVEEGLVANADPRLMRVTFDNLLANSWKFTGTKAHARIEVGAAHLPNEQAYFIRDNGVGFDSSKTGRLFQPFERLHSAKEFPGSGIGLFTVRRIIERHGGRIWAESSAGQGATFYFTLPEDRQSASEAGGGSSFQLPNGSKPVVSRAPASSERPSTQNSRG